MTGDWYSQINYFSTWKSFGGSHAEVCPVCGGSGDYIKNGLKGTCHGCGGKGWIMAPESKPLPNPFLYWPPPYWYPLTIIWTAYTNQ